jgi:hypothetical protein
MSVKSYGVALSACDASAIKDYYVGDTDAHTGRSYGRYLYRYHLVGVFRRIQRSTDGMYR